MLQSMGLHMVWRLNSNNITIVGFLFDVTETVSFGLKLSSSPLLGYKGAWIISVILKLEYLRVLCTFSSSRLPLLLVGQLLLIP